MKYEENEVRNLFAPILPLSAETKHKITISFDIDNVTHNEDIRDFRDKVNDIIKHGEFIKSTINNPFGGIVNKINKDGDKETSEKVNDLKITIEYSDLINATFEIGSIIADLKPIMDMYLITTKKINKGYESKEGEKVVDDFSDIADGSVKELG